MVLPSVIITNKVKRETLLNKFHLLEVHNKPLNLRS